MAISDKLTKLAQTKSAIKTAIETKGVTVGSIPFGQYPAKIEAIEGGGGGGFDTSQIIRADYMFYNSPLTTLDLNGLDTSSVTNMTYMFFSSKATTLDLSSFDTSNVTNMSFMFRAASATTLDLSSFDTSKVTNMGNMFYGSKATIGYARTQLDADKFNASSNKPTGLWFAVKTVATKHYDLSGAEINQILTDLPTVTGTQVLDFSECAGVADCDPSIGTAKGWNIIT